MNGRENDWVEKRIVRGMSKREWNLNALKENDRVNGRKVRNYRRNRNGNIKVAKAKWRKAK